MKTIAGLRCSHRAHAKTVFDQQALIARFQYNPFLDVATLAEPLGKLMRVFQSSLKHVFALAPLTRTPSCSKASARRGSSIAFPPVQKGPVRICVLVRPVTIFLFCTVESVSPGFFKVRPCDSHIALQSTKGSAKAMQKLSQTPSAPHFDCLCKRTLSPSLQSQLSALGRQNSLSNWRKPNRKGPNSCSNFRQFFAHLAVGANTIPHVSFLTVETTILDSLYRCP